MTLQPTHLIGDPCYFLHTQDVDPMATDYMEGQHMENQWVQGFCATLFEEQKAEDFDGHFEYLGHPIFVHGTAYGDGSYEGTDGRSYYVDSGLIGAIPVQLIEHEVVQDMLKQPHVRAVSMTRNNLEVSEYDGGTFVFRHSEGLLEIETDPEEEYECEDCGAEISEYEYHDEALCRWCIADREEAEREEEEEEW